MLVGLLSRLLSRENLYNGFWVVRGLVDHLYRRLSPKNAKVVRPTLFNYITTREEFELYTNELWKIMTEGKFTTRIHETYPLEDVARAHNVSQHRCT